MRVISYIYNLPFAIYLLCAIWLFGHLTISAINTHYDFVVPDDGTFNEAIDKANNRSDKNQRFTIFVKAGSYKIGTEENVITTLTAPKTSIIGEGCDKTQLYNTPKEEGIGITSTLFVKDADSTVIEDIELWCNFDNDFNAFANRAVALNEKNCKGNILRRVSLRSTQDTYYTNNDGDTYLEDCNIYGTMDFICGGGTVFFNHCNLILVARGNTGKRDVIVAPATEENREVGYVFWNCTIDGSAEQNGKYWYGRAWRNEPKVVFINTKQKIRPAKEPWGEISGCHWNHHAVY